MSWTYSGDPAYSSRDAVRFLIQDTDSTSQLVQNEEIDWALTKHSNVYLAAAKVARVLGARFTEQATSKSVGGLSMSYAERGQKYNDLAKSLESDAKRGVGAVVAPYAGGISISDKEAIDADTDLVKSWARIGMHDNPGSNVNPALSTSW